MKQYEITSTITIEAESITEAEKMLYDDNINDEIKADLVRNAEVDEISE